MATISPQIIRPREALAPEIGAAIFDLTNRVWPSADEARAPERETTLERWRAQQSAHFVIGEGATRFWRTR